MKILKLTDHEGAPVVVMADKIEYVVQDIDGALGDSMVENGSNKIGFRNSIVGAVIGMPSGETIVVQDRFTTVVDMLEAL